mgnify:CR=1 FL=1
MLSGFWREHGVLKGVAKENDMFEIKGIKKSYGKKEVLSGVSFEIAPKEIVGVLGANGSGKSTLLSVLAGLQPPNGGFFSMDGKDLLKNNKLRNQQVSYVPQDNPLIEELTAYDNLRMWMSADKIKRELKNGVLKVLGIDTFLKVPVAKMSGGMKKRLSIACAMNSSPGLMLLDEPTAAIDLVCRDSIYNYFEDFLSGGGAILLATHELQEIELCDKCYILKNGKLSEYYYDGDISNLAGRL